MAEPLKYRYYRYYVNGVPYVDATGLNIPQGAQEIQFDDFINSAKSQYVDNSYGKGVSYYDFLQNNNPQALKPNADSGWTTWTDPLTGKTEYIQQTELDKYNATANDPNMVQVSPGVYVPKGSAGEANLVNIGTNNTADAANANLPAPTTSTEPPTGSPVQGGGQTGTGLGTGLATVSGTGLGTGAGSGGTTAPTLTNEQMRANLSAILPAEMIGMIPDSQLAAFSAIADSFKQQYAQGVVNADIQAKDLQDAINSVLNDVEFQAKYGDQLKLATANFQNNLQDFQFQTGQLATRQAQQFTDQQKALAEEKAAMGQAYSGFRQQAKQRLASDQTGIIESTRQQIKNNLTNLGQSWEGMFGSAQAQTPSVDYVNPLTGQLEKQAYNPLGQVYGSVPLAQKQEQETLGAQRYDAVKLPI